jgi:ribosomal protein S18 acetylase RimI-like enzyme
VAERPTVTPYASVIDPLLHPDLKGFTCGGSQLFEHEVDEIVDAFRIGHRPEQLQFVIGRTTATDEIVGVCAIHERDLPNVSPGALYVGVIAVNDAFRGFRLEDETRLGDWLLRTSLIQLQETWGTIPVIWALIDPDNIASQELFSRHGFAEIPNDGYCLFVRPEGLSAA